MNVTFRTPPSGGTIAAIPSKSAAHRLLICASFADRPTHLRCSSTNDDIHATIRALEALGARIVRNDDGFTVHPVQARTVGRDLDCGESGSTLRFLLPIAASLGTSCRFIRRARLPYRPLSPLYEELRRHGAVLPDDPTTEPLPLSGKIGPGDYTLAANVSSQFISGMLLAMPLMNGTSTLTLTDSIESEEYIRITTTAMNRFGASFTVSEDGRRYSVFPFRYHSPGTVTVEGDWSAAGVWLTAGAIGHAPITVTGLDPASPQGDRRIVDVLRQFGARIEQTENSITVYPSALHGIRLDIRQIPDLVPAIAAAAAAAEGTTEIEGIERLRIKESDRAAVITDMLDRLGGDVICTETSLIIRGGKPLAGGTVSAVQDHRMLMGAFLFSLLSSGAVTVTGAECISKSYPGFFEDLAAVGGATDLQEVPQ